MINVKTLCLFLFASIGFIDNAYAKNKYDAYISNTVYSADLSNKSNFRPSLNITDKHLNGNVRKSHNEIINLFQNFDNLKPELEKSIKALLEDEVIHYRWLRLSINGPVEVVLKKLDGGRIK